MNLSDAQRMGKYFVGRLSPFCLPGCCEIAGGTRRGKDNVHDLEIVCVPDLTKRPRPQMGMKVSQLPKNMLQVALSDLERDDFLFFKQGKERNRKYWINLAKFGIPEGEGFLLDLWITLPPAQYGVNLVIRTGPGSLEDNFSKWIVTERSKGGALPNGYCVRDVAVWHKDQIGANDRPNPGAVPLSMPTEESFLDFLGISAAPQDRHAQWGRGG